MDKDSFLAFCRSELTKRGFRKYKSMYFLSNQKDILCGIWLKKSNFGPKYTVCYYYFVGLFDSPKEYPTRYDFDFADSIKVMSCVTSKGKRFLTGEIEYENYTEDELLPFFTEAFEEHILPPLHRGKNELYAHLSHLRFPPTKSKDEILAKIE